MKNKVKYLLAAISIFIVLNLGGWSPGVGFNSVMAQPSNGISNKTITFDTFVFHLADDGVMNKFDFDRQVINGTNEQLMGQFPEVLNNAYRLAGYDVGGNMTQNSVAFVDFERGNSTVIPYQNVTLQTYLNEFSNSLKQMDRTDNPSSQRCWIMYPDGEGRDIHVHRCW
jgi:hypothetical protein